MRLMITGVTGFLGSALAQHLVSQGHTVLGTSRRAAHPSEASLS